MKPTLTQTAAPDESENSSSTLFQKISDVLSLIRFSHTIFALPFALLSAIVAWQIVPFRAVDLLGILACMVFARSAAMAFNRLVDRSIDLDNPRTATRHLPSGKLSVRFVVIFTLVSVLGFIASTLLFLPNRWPLMLSIPFILFLLGYSYAKRFTMFCHYWLSAALMLSPIGAWIAIAGQLDWPPVWLAAVIFFWVGGFDILYATQDADYDRTKRLHSMPARLGISASLKVAMLSHLLMIGCLIAFWIAAGFGLVFLLGVMIVAVLIAYEHAILRPDDLSKVNIAFFNINSLVSLGLLIAAIVDILLRASIPNWPQL